MGRDLHDSFASVRDLYQRADEMLARPISTLCFDGPAEELSRTVNSQPALFLTSMACLEAARASGVLEGAPDFVAGHSLGEYSALAAASAWTFEEGLHVVERRGTLTQAAADATGGCMAAVIGMDEVPLAETCAEAGAEVCNINAHGQIVIGGPREAVDRACTLALARGARRAIPLDVGGAFHTSLMSGAQAGMRDVLAETAMRQPAAPMIANSTAGPMSDPSDIKDELVFQLTHPVRWVQCVEYMAQQGVTQMVEIGPGRVLAGLVKRIAPDIKVRNINSVESLKA